MKIEKYRFGEIVVEGKKYTADLIIYPEKIKSSWWRKQGHFLVYQDIEEALKEKPEVIIIGTGASGVMEVPSSLIAEIKKQGIEVIVEQTEKACQRHNELKEKKRVITCLHLTC